jgi:hypothetical protein
MTTQDQIIGALDARLKQAYQQLQGLQQQASAGLGPMLSARPDDYLPFNNALTAIAHQARDLSSGIHDVWGDEISDQLSDLAETGVNTDAAYDHADKLVREGTHWMDDQWARFESYWRLQAIHAMWPLVEQGMAQPASCSNCGAPLATQQRRVSESVSCGACSVVNQTTPQPVVAMYYSIAPDIHATNASLDARAQVDAQRHGWDNQRVAIRQQTGEWPDEPIESLRQWEQLERAYWTTYAQAKAQIEPHDEAGFIESRMKFFYDDMARNEVWREANGMGPSQAQVASQIDQLPDDLTDWGPLTPNQVEENFYHQQLLSMIETEPAMHQQTLAKLGYRDGTHRAVVERTFSRHYVDQAGEAWFQQAVTAAAMRAMQDRGGLMADANQDLLSPIEGVTLEAYAQISAKQGSGNPEDLMQVLAQHQLDREKFDRVSKAWMARMSTDTTGAIATAYSKAFMGQGQYGAAGQAAADNLGTGGMATGGGADGAEPVSFEKYAEISGAMSAWSQQAKDISVMLDQHFQMTATDFSNISMWWSTKMSADFTLYEKLSELTEHYEREWMAR